MSRVTIDTRSLPEHALVAAGRALRETLDWPDSEKHQLIAEVWARKVIVVYARAAEKGSSA